MQRRPDITLAREALGWEPKVGLQDGLAQTIAYFTQLRAELGAAAPHGAAQVRRVGQ